MRPTLPRLDRNDIKYSITVGMTQVLKPLSACVFVQPEQAEWVQNDGGRFVEIDTVLSDVLGFFAVIPGDFHSPI